jgi:hypothetical protein
MTFLDFYTLIEFQSAFTEKVTGDLYWNRISGMKQVVGEQFVPRAFG